MKRRNIRLKALFYVNVLTLLILVSYKIYLALYKPDVEAVHTEQLLDIDARLQDRDRFSFAVVGNMNNSVGIFERTFIPELNQSGLDFMVSAGNAVSSGGEDKYRSLHGTLEKLEMPFLLTFGANEYSNFGSFRFYEDFGPHLYSVRAANTRLIFLDSTGKTPYRWQLHWLGDLLEQSDAMHTLVFTGHPLLPIERNRFFVRDDDYLQPDAFRAELLELFRRYEVDVVFSANLPVFSEQVRDGTRFITTGGAGGLILNDSDSFHHYVEVTVTPESVETRLVPLVTGQHPFWATIESLWFFFYSLFYVGFVNFLLLVSLLSLIAIRLYLLLFTERNYYRDFDINPAPWLDKPLRVAMFTNNYLPFIGGVPISIERLRLGLRDLGNKVLLVAPRYRDQPDDEQDTLRLPSLLAFGKPGDFRLANIFLPRVRRHLQAFRPDIIHVHHPIWVGSLGLYLGKRLGVPVVYTYHTRLEHYAHFVPLPGGLFRNFISHALIKRFANKCDGIIVPTYSAEEYLRMIGVKTPTYVQPTGIEYQRFLQTAPENVRELRKQFGITDEVVLVTVSRLSNEKNLDFMMDAAAALKRTSKRAFRLLIIGDGHQRARLQQRIDDLDLSGAVTLLGSVAPAQMPLYYRLGDLFVFTSKSETQGMVLLEAMAAGLAVVAVRSSGTDDVIREGFNGYKTAGSQSAWVARVDELIQDETLRSRLGINARDFAQDYSVERFAREVKSIYAEILART
ncbi:glycosyltransferase [Pseudomonas sp. gcc21]|uniref:glycosyltransferase n=1 Tax=Pseudomonas sp. gcc21 TaxID=2726989 RepID=UPI0014521A00|nr:glycosyltransferase [Pseudomonas sp. gcc21]QJD57703.1 glycosyltransferase [Pseudomonas sp. gcc21]